MEELDELSCRRARRRSNSSDHSSTLTDCESQEFGEEEKSASCTSTPKFTKSSPPRGKERGSLNSIPSFPVLSSGTSSEDGDSGSGEEEEKMSLARGPTSASPTSTSLMAESSTPTAAAMAAHEQHRQSSHTTSASSPSNLHGRIANKKKNGKLSSSPKSVVVTNTSEADHERGESNGSFQAGGAGGNCNMLYSLRGDEGLVFGSQEHFERMLSSCITAFDYLVARSLRVQNQVKQVLVEEVTMMIRESCPLASVHVFGSCTTGLALPHSDIDLVVQLQPTKPITTSTTATVSMPIVCTSSLPASTASCSANGSPSSSSSTSSSPPSLPPLSSSDVMRGLYALSDKLYQEKWAVGVTPISTSTVPVIKFSVQAGDFLFSCCSPRRAAAEAEKNKRRQQEVLIVNDGNSSNSSSSSNRSSGSSSSSNNNSKNNSNSPPTSPRSKTPWFLCDKSFMQEAAKTLIPVDISIEAGEHRGMQTCAFVKDALARRHPCLPSVIKIVKNFLYWSNLNNAFTGGLSSYSVVLLCCAAHDNLFFTRQRAQEQQQQLLLREQQQRKREKKRRGGNEAEDEEEEEKEEVEREEGQEQQEEEAAVVEAGGAAIAEDQLPGKLFLHFLAMFCTLSFDPTIIGVDVDDPTNPSCLFRLSKEECANIGTSIWIRDPFDRSKNVARPSFNFRHVSLCFADMLANLLSEHQKMVEEGVDGWNRTHFRPLLFRHILW